MGNVYDVFYSCSICSSLLFFSIAFQKLFWIFWPVTNKCHELLFAWVVYQKNLKWHLNQSIKITNNNLPNKSAQLGALCLLIKN